MVAKYVVRGIEDSIIGEGTMAGTRVVRVLFGGCNYWDGTPEGRSKGKAACAKWCDEDFNSSCSKSMTAEEIAIKTESILEDKPNQWIVLSGGEPTMFIDQELIAALADYGFKIYLETNCSQHVSSEVLRGIDYISARPKLEPGTDGQLHVPALGVVVANELVITLPGSIDGNGWRDDQLHRIEMEGDWDDLYVVPMDPTDGRTVLVTHLRGGYDRPEELDAAVKRCLEWIRECPQWKIGVQLHKVFNL